MEAKLIPLEQLYLMSIAAAAERLKMDVVLQDLEDGKTGRLWLVAPGTTVPFAQLAFEFDLDSVKLGILHRDQRELVRVVKYVEGIDGFLEEMLRFFQAGRIAHKSRVPNQVVA